MAASTTTKLNQGKEEITARDVLITVLELVLFCIAMTPAYVMRNGFLKLKEEIPRESSDYNREASPIRGRPELEQIYWFGSPEVTQQDIIVFAFAVTVAPITMLLLCVEHPKNSPTRVKFVKQLVRSILRYYLVFLMGGICLSITLDVIRLNNDVNPSGLLSTFFLDTFEDVNTDVNTAAMLNFPSYGAAITAYVATFLALTANMLLAPRDRIWSQFGRLFVTMGVAIAAVAIGYRRYVVDEGGRRKMLLSWVIGICAALYVVCVVLKGYSKSRPRVIVIKTSRSNRVYLRLNRPSDIVHMLSLNGAAPAPGPAVNKANVLSLDHHSSPACVVVSMLDDMPPQVHEV